MPEIKREFKDGKMIVTMPNGNVREVPVENLERRLTNMDKRLQNLTDRKAEIEGWIEKAKASA